MGNFDQMSKEAFEGAEIASDSFYPRPTKKQKNNSFSDADEFKQLFDLTRLPRSSLLLSNRFREFDRQDDAFKCADRDFNAPSADASGPTIVPFHQRVHVFAREFAAGAGGARKYLVCSLQEFWTVYAKTPPDEKCFYEIIRDRQPCHLYFDLEFSQTANPTRDGNHMVSAFIAILRRQLKLELGVRERQIFFARDLWAHVDFRF